MPKKRKINKKIVAVISIIIAIILIIFSFYWIVLRTPTITINELVEMIDPNTGKMNARVGDKYIIKGTVAYSGIGNSTYGIITYVRLENEDSYIFSFMGNQIDNYPTATEVDIPIEFKEFRFNNESYIWPDNFFFPSVSMIEGVAYSLGRYHHHSEEFFLFPSPWNVTKDNPIELWVFPSNGTLPLSSITMSLYEGSSVPYPCSNNKDRNPDMLTKIDTLELIDGNTSQQSLFTFIDKDHDSNLSDHDAIELNIEGTDSKYEIKTYLIMFESGNDDSVGILIPVWYDGFFYNVYN